MENFHIELNAMVCDHPVWFGAHIFHIFLVIVVWKIKHFLCTQKRRLCTFAMTSY